MVALNWTDGAIADMEAIAEYIAKNSPIYASIQVEKILEKTNQIITYPFSGRKVPELNEESVRELIVDSYRLIYKIVSDNRIDILTVHHSNRLLSNNPNIDS